MNDRINLGDVEIALWRVFVRPLKRKKRCPDCLARVLKGAVLCKHCHHRFDEAESTPYRDDEMWEELRKLEDAES